ncbi:MAG: PaaI family thioesterase [Pyrinomonadaceae bacterium]
MNFEPIDDNFAERIKQSFAEQSVMKLIGAELIKVAAGEIDIKLPFRRDLTQQDGFLHAGIATTIVDTACGYAAYSLMPAESRVLSVEFKVNLLSPAVGDYFVAEGRIIKAGKTLTVARGDVFAFQAENKKLIATMLATMICRTQ